MRPTRSGRRTTTFIDDAPLTESLIAPTVQQQQQQQQQQPSLDAIAISASGSDLYDDGLPPPTPTSMTYKNVSYRFCREITTVAALVALILFFGWSFVFFFIFVAWIFMPFYRQLALFFQQEGVETTATCVKVHDDGRKRTFRYFVLSSATSAAAVASSNEDSGRNDSTRDIECYESVGNLQVQEGDTLSVFILRGYPTSCMFSSEFPIDLGSPIAKPLYQDLCMVLSTLFSIILYIVVHFYSGKVFENGHYILDFAQILLPLLVVGYLCLKFAHRRLYTGSKRVLLVQDRHDEEEGAAAAGAKYFNTSTAASDVSESVSVWQLLRDVRMIWTYTKDSF